MIIEDRKQSQKSSIFFNELSEFRGEWNRVLVETKHFIVVPTLGMLVEGWLLISPKRRNLSFSKLSDKEWDDFQLLKNQLNCFFNDCYSVVPTYFEHGPSRVSSVVGCGVDYAHMHVAPLKCDLMDDATLVGEYIWEKSCCDLNKNSGLLDKPYLFVDTEKGEFLSIDQDFPSQTIRKAIARLSGQEDYWNWRDFHLPARIAKTTNIFNTWLKSQ